MFAPADDAIQEVRDWLIEAGIDRRHIRLSDNKGWLALDISASEAERLFHSEYYEHEHISSGNIRIGCDEYGIP